MKPTRTALWTCCLIVVASFCWLAVAPSATWADRRDEERAELDRRRHHELEMRERAEMERRRHHEREEMAEHGRHMRDEMAEHGRHMREEMGHLVMFNKMLDLMGRMAEIAEHPEASAVVAIMSLEDYMEMEEAADFLQEVLPDVTNPTVRRAIRFKLIEVYGHLDNQDGVRDQLRALIFSANEEDEDDDEDWDDEDDEDDEDEDEDEDDDE